MSLLSRIERLPPLVEPSLPALKRIESAAERVLTKWPDVIAEPAPTDREAIVQEVLHRLRYNSWEGTKLSRVTSAARALFDEERREREDLADLRKFYFDEIRASTRAGFLSAMFTVYLSSYQPAAKHTIALARALKASVHRLSARWRILLEAVPDCLNPRTAHTAIAALMLDMNDPWSELKALGIWSPHGAGVMDHAHLAYVSKLKPSLDERLVVKRLITWLKPDKGDARRAGAAEAISAMLAPWKSRKPPLHLDRYLVSELVEMYGDPRVQRGGVWGGVDRDLMAVIMRWLTGENIKFFLDVVSQVEDSHMWEPRREFWLGLHQDGRIDAAWVAFSRAGALVASASEKRGDHRQSLAFGHQIAGGTRSTTSLLILKIGSKIIVEGSHSYKVHIFDEGRKGVPALYQSRYDCEEIRLNPLAAARAHLSGWQNWVMEYI
jgi:hypothetical protein